jgi:hypothetical protein
MQIKTKVEFEVEVINPEIAIITKQFVDNYKDNVLIRAGADKQEGWLVLYTPTDNAESEFQRFLHDEFLPLIPILEVVKDNNVNTLSWPMKETEKVLKIIEAKKAVPEL